jgi:AcrR family transcriptional regulator
VIVAERPPRAAEKLARCALELFSRHGIRDVSMQMIAAHANCTKGSLYWHYDSKKDVVLAACGEYYRAWRERIREEIAGVTDPLKRLEKAVRFSIRSCMIDSKNRVFTLGVMALSLQDEDVRESWGRFYGEAREFLTTLVAEAKAAGRIRPADPRRAVEMVLVAFEGIKLKTVFEPSAALALEEKRIHEEFMEILGGLGRGARSKGGLRGRLENA